MFNKYVQFKKSKISLTDFNDLTKDIEMNIQLQQYCLFFTMQEEIDAKGYIRIDKDVLNVFLLARFQEFDKKTMARLIDQSNAAFLKKHIEYANMKTNYMMLIVSNKSTDLLHKMIKKDRFLTIGRCEEFYYNLKFYVIEEGNYYEQIETKDKHIEAYNYSNWNYRKLTDRN